MSDAKQHIREAQVGTVMDEEGDISVGLMLWIIIGMAIMAACGIVSFSLFLVGYLAL